MEESLSPPSSFSRKYPRLVDFFSKKVSTPSIFFSEKVFAPSIFFLKMSLPVKFFSRKSLRLPLPPALPGAPSGRCFLLPYGKVCRFFSTLCLNYIQKSSRGSQRITDWLTFDYVLRHTFTSRINVPPLHIRDPLKIVHLYLIWTPVYWGFRQFLYLYRNIWKIDPHFLLDSFYLQMRKFGDLPFFGIGWLVGNHFSKRTALIFCTELDIDK